MDFVTSKLNIFSSDRSCISTLCAVFICSVLIVNPLGNFPLNDDFQYAYPVQALWEHGSYQLAHSFAPNIFLQVLWGYFFSQLAGEFNYTILRFSTLFLSLVTILYLFKLLKLVSQDRQRSFYLTLLFVYTPVFFLSSFSFMTEVPFMALVSMALFYYVRHLREPSAVWTRIAGFLFAILAFMIRQPAILLIFTFEVLQIWKYRRNWKKTTGSVGFMLAALGIYILVDRVLMNYLEVGQQYQSVVQVYFSVLTDYPIDFIYRQVKYNVYTVIMSGFYLSPLLMSLYALLKGKGVANKHLTIWLGTAFILALLIWFAGHTFPYNGSIFKNFTLGVSLLLDWTWWPNQTLPSLSDWVWIPVSVVSIFCSGLIFYSLWQSRTRSVIQWMLMLVVSYQLLMTIFSFTDRYFIWTLFVLLVALATIPMPRVSWAFYIPLLLLMYLSIAGTKDYLEWNRLVKERYSALVEQGISPQKIDAGMPINSHFSDIHPWTPNATHVFSFTKVDNRQIRDSISFFRYLSLEQDQIYILSGEQ